jgi:ankyrin repeat protein
MKSLKFAIAFTLLTAVPSISSAQNASDGAAFVAAVKKSDGDAAKKLLDEHGASLVNSRDYEGNTALVAAVGNKSEEWTGFLLNEGADPNLAGTRGETPLIAAARIGFDEAVGWLLSKGAKVDGANKMGETALIVAVQQRRPAIVRALLRAGADPDKTDSAAGLSARDYATRDGRSREIVSMLEAKPKAATKR